MTRVLTKSILPFFLLAGIVIFSTWFVVNSEAFAQRPSLLALASTIDMVLIIPVAYFLLIRKTKIPNITVTPVLILSVLAARQLIPAEHQQAIRFIEMLLPLIELFIIGFIVYNGRKVFRAYAAEKKKGVIKGFVEVVNEATQMAYGKSAFSNALATEISVFHYALLGWGPQIEAPKANRFTYHKDNGYYALLGVILFALVVETAVFHLLLMQWSNVAAWILSGLSIYSLFFVLGDLNAIRKRPIYLKDGRLHIRIGLRWRVAIPVSEIESIELRTPDKEKESFANFILAGEANTVINFKSEIKAQGLYGLKKRFTRLGLYLDQKQEFYKLLSPQVDQG